MRFPIATYRPFVNPRGIAVDSAFPLDSRCSELQYALMHGRRLTGHPSVRVLLSILFAALLMRLCFFAFMASRNDSTNWESTSPDVSDYTASAEKIADAFDFNTVGVQTFGPGYPLFLAFLRLITGHSPIGMMLLHILLSSVVSVLIAAWAFRLTNDTRTAWIAGMLNALSFTAISLANIFLSETLFMALMIGGALLLSSAMHRSRYLLAIFAGFLLGSAILTRSMGIGLPLVLLALAFVGDRSGLIHRLKIGGACLVTAFALIFSWSALFNPDSSRVTGAVPSAMFRIVRAIDVQQKKISMTEATRQFEAACQQHAKDSTGDYLASNRALSISRFKRVLREDPLAVAMVILRNIRDNMHNEFSMVRLQIPSIDRIYESIRIFNAKKGLNYRVSLLALIGAILLISRRQWRVCLLLVLIFGYFAVMSGFSDSQTSRIFYPAQLGWSVLVAVTLLTFYDWLKGRRLIRRPG